MSLGTQSSNSSTTQTSPGAVGDYWKAATSGIGGAPGYSSGGGGSSSGGYWADPGTTTAHGGGSVWVPTADNINAINTDGTSTLVSYGSGYDIYGNPIAGSSGSSDGGYTYGATTGNYGGGFSSGTSSFGGQEYPALAESEFSGSGTPIATWIDYPGLDTAMGMLDSVYPTWERLSGGDYQALQDSIYGSATAGLDTAKANDTTKFWTEAANRGLGDDPSAQLLYGETILTPYNNTVEKAGYDAAMGRYGLESTDLAAYNTGTTGRINEINDQLTERTNAQNAFNQWASGEGDARANMENSFNLTSDSQENSYNSSIWSNIWNNWLNQLGLWYKGLGSNSESSGWGVNLGLFPSNSGGGTTVKGG